MNNVLRLFKQHPTMWYTAYECGLEGYDVSKDYLNYLYAQGILKRCLKRTYKHWMSYAYRWDQNEFTTKMLEDLGDLK